MLCLCPASVYCDTSDNNTDHSGLWMAGGVSLTGSSLRPGIIKLLCRLYTLALFQHHDLMTRTRIALVPGIAVLPNINRQLVVHRSTNLSYVFRFCHLCFIS